MTAALLPIQRPRQAKLLVLDSSGNIRHLARSRVVDLFRRGDLVIAQPIVPVAAMQLFLGREISACVLKIGQSLRN